MRSATIRTRNGVTNRPVSKLYPFEVATNDATSIRSQVTDEQDGDLDDKEVTASELTNQHVDRRPKRGAAERARQRILEWTGCIRTPPPPPRMMSEISMTGLLTIMHTRARAHNVVMLSYIESLTVINSNGVLSSCIRVHHEEHVHSVPEPSSILSRPSTTLTITHHQPTSLSTMLPQNSL